MRRRATEARTGVMISSDKSSSISSEIQKETTKKRHQKTASDEGKVQLPTAAALVFLWSEDLLLSHLLFRSTIDWSRAVAPWRLASHHTGRTRPAPKRASATIQRDTVFCWKGDGKRNSKSAEFWKMKIPGKSHSGRRPRCICSFLKKMEAAESCHCSKSAAQSPSRSEEFRTKERLQLEEIGREDCLLLTVLRQRQLLLWIFGNYRCEDTGSRTQFEKFGFAFFACAAAFIVSSSWTWATARKCSSNRTTKH